ncbi:hypothetical protein GY45DRAFT_284063 [Cubamyces sp. BRFM 1775]|nr:hypothetical protein GY45DRAFT_284063 [Cubamyces sp. BRFM 1775]
MPRATNSTPDSDVIIDNTRRDVLIFRNPPPNPSHPEDFGGWYNDTPWRAPGEVGYFYNDSLSSVEAPGGSVEFHFKGTQIAVFGTVITTPAGLPAPVSWYSINGNDFTKYSPPNVSVTHNGVNFYTSPELALDDHVLTINVTTATSQSDYWLDWIEYNITARGTPHTTSGTSSSSVSPTDSPSKTPGVSADRSKSTPVGAIAGGAIGGVVLVLAAILAFVFWKRRNQIEAEIPKDYDYGPRGRPDAIPPATPYDSVSQFQSAAPTTTSRGSSPDMSPSMAEHQPMLLAARTTPPVSPPPSFYSAGAPPLPPPPHTNANANAPPSASNSGTGYSGGVIPPSPGAPTPASASARKNGGKKGARNATSPTSATSSSSGVPPEGTAQPQVPSPSQPPQDDHRLAMLEDPVFEEDAATDLPPAYASWT